MLAILRKEFNAFFNSLIAYVVVGVFLVMLGLFVWVLPDSSVLEYGYADLGTLFSTAPFVFLFLVPAITMRTFAEEKRAGTIELLLTRPLTDWQLILGKYFACVLLAVVALVPTLIYYFTVWQLGAPKGNVDSAAVAGSYLGLVLLAATFAALGVLASALTRDQIIAFILAVFGSYLLYAGFAALASVNVWGRLAYPLSQLGIAYHYGTISKGLIDSRDVLYFLSIIGTALAATKLTLATRNW